MNQTNSNQAGPSPDFAQAQFLAHVARLPELYERITFSRDQKSPDDLKQDAITAVAANAPEGITRENIFILTRDNVTAIVVYDPKNNTASIAFDPTHPAGSWLKNADKSDNIDVRLNFHPLGGGVHNGFYAKLTDDPNHPHPSMITRLEGVLHDLANRDSSRPLTVNFTGFSRGGAQAVTAAGEMMSNGLFDQNSNIRLGNVYTFSTPGYGNPAFVSAFDKKVSELGGQAWAIEIHGDTMPTVLTPNAERWVNRHPLGQAGNHAYIIPSQSGEAGTVLINLRRMNLPSCVNNRNPQSHGIEANTYWMFCPALQAEGKILRQKTPRYLQPHPNPS